MSLKAIFSFVIIILIGLTTQAAVLTIKGHVINDQQQPLVGATVSIPDLKVTVSTNNKGEFSFTSIPSQGNFLIVVKYLGYMSVAKTVDLTTISFLEFIMHPSVIEAREVVITGSAFSSNTRKNSTSVTSINKAELKKAGSSNIIDALSKVAGVSQITTGGSVSKPVIRGLSGNRVITLSNGVKQEGQQWGDEHGIEIDQYDAENVEVLRGAASLLYGSDALGGVINLIDPLSPTNGQIRGEFLTNYASNNGLTGTSAMLQGNSNGLVWRGRGSYKNAYSYKSPDGYIANTGFKETDMSGQIGLNKKWGYTHLSLSSFNSKLGLPDFKRNSMGQFEDENGNVFSQNELKSRTPLLPFQDVRHYKVSLNSNVLLKLGRLKTIFAFQNNQRREMEETQDPSLFFDLNTYSGDIKYYFPQKNGWEPVIGISSSHQKSINKAEELLIPDYSSTDYGIVGYTKKTWSNNTFNMGARFDHRIIKGIQMTQNNVPKFSDFSNRFSNVSGATGFTHEFNDEFSFKANAGTAFRAPNIAELSSDGVHEGTFRYEVGNTSLKQEISYSADFSFDYQGKSLEINIGLFNNYIDNFIYNRQNNNETILVGTDVYPLFKYVQDNANLYGLEANVDYHPINIIHFENTFSFTRGQNRATNTPLPFIPAGHLINELRFEPNWKTKSISSTFLSLQLNSFFNQNKIADFETSTSGYSLVGLSFGTTLHLKEQPVTINITGNNLLNKSYYDHLSRFKPGRLDEQNPTSGYYNLGRNISFGIYIPLSLTK